MNDGVTRWLLSLGLEGYAAAFAENAIEESMLADLSDADLKELGVAALGHRKTMLKSIAALGLGDPTPPDPHPRHASEGPTHADPGTSTHAFWERVPGERKPVTLLFADVVRSTALTENLDAEETHDLLYGVTQRMCEAVESNRGTVCRFMGDGVMAMFGAPLASERHAVDACEAALGMQRSVAEYASHTRESHGFGFRHPGRAPLGRGSGASRR